ncbi:MAG: helix-turn-helix transcriptional regulator [Bacteroidota bacterium]
MAEEDLFSATQLANFGKRLKQIRKERGYSNYEHFAYQNGFNRVQYGRYENGANISLKTLCKIVKAFDMSLAEFFSEGFE